MSKMETALVAMEVLQPDPVAQTEEMVEQLMLHLKGMTVSDLAKLSKRIQLRLHRKGRWIYLKDGRVSSQLELPRSKATSTKRLPCCLAVQPKAPF